MADLQLMKKETSLFLFLAVFQLFNNVQYFRDNYLHLKNFDGSCSIMMIEKWIVRLDLMVPLVGMFVPLPGDHS